MRAINKSKRGGATAGGIALGLGAAAAQELRAPDPVWIGVAIVAGLVGIYAIYLFIFQKEQPVAESGGGVTHNIHVENSPHSVVAGRDVRVEVNVKQARPVVREPQIVSANESQGDGTYLTRAVLEIEDHFAAQSALRVEPHGKGIVDLQLFNSPSHMPRGLQQQNLMTQGHIRQFGPPLSARYEIEVRTKEPEHVEIEVTQL